MLKTPNLDKLPNQRPRACERCHRYKERCSFEKMRHACTSCLATGEPCRLRSKKRMGRRAVAKQLRYGTTSIIQLTTRVEKPMNVGSKDHMCSTFASSKASVPEPRGLTHALTRCSPSGPPNLASNPIEVMLTTTEGFFNVHQTFMLGASFVEDFQSVVRRLFARSPKILTESYSVAMRLMPYRHESCPRLDSHDLATAAHCLEILTDASLAVTDVEDAAVVVLLGQALLVYNTLIPSLATQAITRGILLNVSRWYPALLREPNLDAISLTPILIDTIDCLIRRELPVVRLPDLHRCVVDRFLGVCSSLLPLLHDLCQRSCEARISGAKSDPISPAADGHDMYSGIEQKIRDWSPDLPSNFFTAYSAWEVTVMLTQARTYRLAALLIIHRLRWPLGTQDLIAQRHAEDILQELSTLKHWPSDAATGVAFDFPLLVGTLELPERGRELYKAFEPYRFRRQHSDEILGLIELVTAAREDGYAGLWFDLAESRLHGITMT